MIISDLMIQDTLRYMQMPKTELEGEIVQEIRSCYAELDTLCSAKTIYSRFPIHIEGTTTSFEDTELTIKSHDLVKLFANCHSVYILAVTLGQNVDRQINIRQKTDMQKALVLDTSASVLVDAICDEVEKEILSELSEGKFLTMRFSPGYGDVPLEVQRQLIDVLDATRKIGLSLTKTNMLIPTKSVTAFIGISSQKENRMKSCEACNASQTCLYKKRGDRCGL